MYKQSITRTLAEAQEAAAGVVVYRLYTEAVDNLPALVARYFRGATIVHGIGIYDAERESCAMIEIASAAPDALQSVYNLAGDIKQTNAQAEVLISWSNAFVLTV